MAGRILLQKENSTCDDFEINLSRHCLYLAGKWRANTVGYRHRNGDHGSGKFSSADAGGKPGGSADASRPDCAAAGVAPCADARPGASAFRPWRHQELRQAPGGEGRKSFGAAKGKSVGLLGPNGAGKTTCFYMITGLITADRARSRSTARTSPACRCTARPPRHRLPAAGSLDLPRLDRRAEHPRRARGDRAEPQASASDELERAARRVPHRAPAQGAGDLAVRRRAAPPRDRPRACHAAVLHAARRAVRRHRPDRRRRHPALVRHLTRAASAC